MIKYKNIIYLLLISPIIIASPDIEEIVITGSLLNNPEQDTSPVDVINQEDYKNFIYDEILSKHYLLEKELEQFSVSLNSKNKF